LLLPAQPQQVGEKSYRIPAGGETPEKPQVPLLAAGAQENPQRFLEGGIPEIAKTGATLCARDQLLRTEPIALNGEHIGDRVSNLREGSLQHRHLFQPTASTARDTPPSRRIATKVRSTA